MFSVFSSSSIDRSSAHDDNEDFDSSRKESHKMGGEVHGHLEDNIRPYIDLIDTLRSFGIEKDLALPTIVVIGDQSSGKSSVLEALSGVALPRGSGIVTRCPLELRLRKVTGGVSWKAIISYRLKRIEFVDSSLVVKHAEATQNELAGKGSGISDELITLEVMSPDVCDLTLIDLPGIARVPLKGQPDDIANQTKSLIKKYIEKHETINMVVVPCNTDIATTEALKMAKEVDLDGKRTIAILTKPDLIDVGTEINILAIAQNKLIPLRKGYIMVKCRGQKQIDDKIPLEEASRMEKHFFENHNYFRCLLDKGTATIKCLAARLTEHLIDHIKKSLPLLDEQIKKQLWDLKKDLKECKGGPPQDPQGARHFLIQTLTGFTDKIKFLSSGELIIEDNLFVQLRTEFQEWNNHLNRTKFPLNGLTADIKECSQRYRGRELLGFSNYRVFEMVLQDHVAKLKEPAIESLNAIKDIIIKQFNDVSYQCFRNYPFLLSIAANKIDNIQSSQHAKAEQRILEQFAMENMIYTQDPIYLKILNEISKGTEKFSEDQIPGIDKRSQYSEMLQAYYEIVVQRMADQVPMLISFFMLKEAALLLCTEILTLLERANVSEMLHEDSKISRRRIDLQSRLERLSIAQEKMGSFIGGV
ncbi:interferon-induced GTP-binding protein Mx2-like isoform X2 [Myxocyprinus asiaticus]|uniref:interferon-induced GTP-binding protein Mx2-like isoform X2 n=1 Tax=Myxocyprinus asiaticus TaxID=70543 RepID=UPI0022221D80|nr:interferon-induced GTP-binding protein Mx2-like isoform X2 [Myxocyprinus asiaticus]